MGITTLELKSAHFSCDQWMIAPKQIAGHKLTPQSTMSYYTSQICSLQLFALLFAHACTPPPPPPSAQSYTGHSTHIEPPLPPGCCNLSEEALLSDCLATVREHGLTRSHSCGQVSLSKQHLTVWVLREPLLSTHANTQPLLRCRKHHVSAL